MANAKAHAKMVERLRDSGDVPSRELGEPIMWPSKGVMEATDRKYNLKSQDEGEARSGLKKFQRSSEYKRFSPYKKKFF